MRDARRPFYPHAPCCFVSLIYFITAQMSEFQFQGSLAPCNSRTGFLRGSHTTSFLSSMRQLVHSLLDFSSGEAKPVQLLQQLLAVTGTQAQLHTQLKASLLALQSSMIRL